MNLLEHLEEIDINTDDVYIVHEKFERRFDMHQHAKGQLSYVEDGIAYLTIYNQHIVVPAKHFFWIPSHVPHQLKVSHSATQLHSMYFKNSAHVFFNTFGIYPASNLIIELIKFAERWNNQFINFDQPHTTCILTLLEIIPLQQASQEIKLPIPESNSMEEIVQYINRNYHLPLQIKDMTKAFNMSERSFCRAFKKELNTTFKQYLKTVRVIQAIELLVKTNKSIFDIANEVGYESLPAFSNMFLEFTSKRPQELRLHFNK